MQKQVITQLRQSTCCKLMNCMPDLYHTLEALSGTNAHVVHETQHIDHFEEKQAKKQILFIYTNATNKHSYSLHPTYHKPAIFLIISS